MSTVSIILAKDKCVNINLWFKLFKWFKLCVSISTLPSYHAFKVQIMHTLMQNAFGQYSSCDQPIIRLATEINVGGHFGDLTKMSYCCSASSASRAAMRR
jgi:hypothetical protein